MTDYIMLPRAWLEPQITSQPDFLRAAVYLAREINEHGSVQFSSGDANMMFGMSPRRYRTFMQIIANDKQTDKQTTNKTTNIAFDCQAVTATKRQARRQTNDKQTDKQKPIQQPIITAKTSSNNLSFIDPAFADAFTTWLEHKKKQFKFEYKTERSLKAAYAELVKLSGNDPDIAMQIVEQSMSNGWKGLFELKNNGTYKPTPTPQRTPDGRQIDRYSALEAAARAVVRRNPSVYPTGND